MFCLHEIKGTKVFREAKLLLRLYKSLNDILTIENK